MKLAMLLINTLMNVMGNQDNVPLKLNALAVDDNQHDHNQWLAEAYKFIGGLDGNLVQLFDTCATASRICMFLPFYLSFNSRDAHLCRFYEPITWLAESPDAFVRGLGKGSARSCLCLRRRLRLGVARDGHAGQDRDGRHVRRGRDRVAAARHAERAGAAAAHR